MDLEPLKIERDAPAIRARSRARPRWIAPVAALAVLGALAWLFHAPIQGFVDGLRLPEVRTMRVAKRSAGAAAGLTGASANGYIVAKTRAALSADTPGRIVQMNVEEGSVVKKGDVVARLYADEYAAALRRADGDLAVAQAAHARATAEQSVAENDLARLRSVEKAAQADVAQAAANLEGARLEHERAVKLLEDGAGSVQRRDQTKAEMDAAAARVASVQAQLQAAKDGVVQNGSHVAVARAAVSQALAGLDVARAGRELAQATLDKTEVRAPFDGIVVLKDAEVGEVVSPNVQGGASARGSVVTMVDFASLEVQAEVPETSLAAVKVGAPAIAYLDAFPDRPYKARVDRIWPTANRSKATVEVRAAFLERDDKLRPEMGVRIVFLGEDAARLPLSTGEAKPVLVVPADAVVKVHGESAVFVLERDTVRLQKIVLGNERAGRLVVESGLSDGDEIVVAPPASLKDGDRVRRSAGA